MKKYYSLYLFDFDLTLVDTTAVIAFPGRNYDSLPHRIKAQQILYDNLLERRATGTLSQYI